MTPATADRAGNSEVWLGAQGSVNNHVSAGGGPANALPHSASAGPATHDGTAAANDAGGCAASSSSSAAAAPACGTAEAAPLAGSSSSPHGSAAGGSPVVAFSIAPEAAWFGGGLDGGSCSGSLAPGEVHRLRHAASMGRLDDAARLALHDVFTSRVGTPQYVAPEVVAEGPQPAYGMQVGAVAARRAGWVGCAGIMHAAYMVLYYFPIYHLL